MGLLDGALGAVFGAALGAVFRDGVLLKSQQTDTGSGAFTASSISYPVKVCVDSLAAGDRPATGVPLTAVRLTVLRAGLTVAIDLDDGITVGGTIYRVIKVDTDPAGAAAILLAVPA